MWQWHQLLSGFPGKGHLPRVSHQSYLSVIVLDYNEVKLDPVHRSTGIFITAGENSGKLQLGDCRVNAFVGNSV